MSETPIVPASLAVRRVLALWLARQAHGTPSDSQAVMRAIDDIEACKDASSQAARLSVFLRDVAAAWGAHAPYYEINSQKRAIDTPPMAMAPAYKRTKVNNGSVVSGGSGSDANRYTTTVICLFLTAMAAAMR